MSAQYLAENIQHLRRQKNWSQSQLASASLVPRSTVANLESGGANPSLDTMLKVAQALTVGLDELLSAPRKSCLKIDAKAIPVIDKKTGAKLEKILPDSIRSMEIDRLVLKIDGYMIGSPHVTGTKEYFYCTKGRVTVVTQGEKYDLKKGDVLAFPGDARHVYRNSATTQSEGFSVVVPVLPESLV